MPTKLIIPHELKLTDIEKYPHIFPKKSKTILKKLRLSDISLYSMIVADNAIYLCDLLDDILKKYKIDMNKLEGLDLGCNTGGVLYYLLKKCKHVTGIEFEPLHVEICYHNIKTLDKKLVKKLTLLYGDVEEIFMGNRLNMVNTKYYNEKYVKSNSKNSKSLENIGLVYIGTPFIDLKYGSTSVELLILKMIKLYNPSIIIVQLPCTIFNEDHNIFYNTTLRKMFQTVHHTYDISFIFDYKKNNKCTNLELVLVKRNKTIINIDYKPFHLKGEYKLQSILTKLVKKFNITCYPHKFNIGVMWRQLYYNSYYTNVVYYNNNLIFSSKTRGENNEIKTTKFKIPYKMPNELNKQNNKNNKKIKCQVKYDRFNNIVSNVVIM